MRSGQIGFCWAVVAVLASAWTMAEGPVPTGPYVLHYPASFGGRYTIPATNPTTQEGVYLGRLLFYEPLLSSTRTISCASCHQQARAFTDGRALSVGVSGKPTQRNAMSLVNLLWVRQLFWDGRSSSLEAQALVPMTHPDEMGLKPGEASHTLQKVPQYTHLFNRVFGSDTITDECIGRAIAQFERTLISASSRYDQYLEGNYKLTESEQRGLQLFNTAPSMELNTRGGNCAHCHGGPKLYQELFHNNGLEQKATDLGRQSITGLELDHERFRVPTLRNVALTAPYMHDGRLATLDDVLDHYSEHIRTSPTLSRELPGQTNGFHLTTGEKTDLIAFLHLLTDSTFIKNPQFSNPHVMHLTSKK